MKQHKSLIHKNPEANYPNGKATVGIIPTSFQIDS